MRVPPRCWQLIEGPLDVGSADLQGSSVKNIASPGQHHSLVGAVPSAYDLRRMDYVVGYREDDFELKC